MLVKLNLEDYREAESFTSTKNPELHKRIVSAKYISGYGQRHSYDVEVEMSPEEKQEFFRIMINHPSIM